MRKVNLFDSEENVNGEIAAGFIPGSTSCKDLNLSYLIDYYF